jgi:starch phosphorylase
VEQRRASYNPWQIYQDNAEIHEALDLIQRDFFSLMEPGIFRPLIDSLLGGGDHYMLLADFRDYIETQEKVDAAYRDRDGWIRRAIFNVARSGRFSSDRTIREYATEIWRVRSCKVE